MQTIFRHSVIVCMVVLCAAYCRAELTANTHNFHTMYTASPKTLEWTKIPDYTYGLAKIAPLLAYQGRDGGTFAYDSGANKYVFQLPDKDSSMETLSAVADLTKFLIQRTPKSANNVKFYYSSDGGANWTEVSAEGITNNSNSIEVQLPAKGNYLIKVKLTSDTDMNIQSVTYYTEPCNCLRVVTE